MSKEAKGVYLRLVVAFGIAVVLTPMLAAWVFPNERWHRVATRTFLALLVLVFASSAGHPRTWPAKLRALGLDGPFRVKRLLLGVGVAFAFMIALLAVEWALGGRAPYAGDHRRSLLQDLGRALFTAVNVAFLEELLCRGFLKRALGGTMSALLYAGAHYFRPMHATQPAGGYDPLLFFRRYPELLEGWTVPNHYTFGLLSLFLFGLALNRLRDRTGTLYVGIGIHLGVVFGLKMFGRWIERKPVGDPLLWGSTRLHDGLFGALGMALLLWWAYRGPIPTLDSSRPPETTPRPPT